MVGGVPDVGAAAASMVGGFRNPGLNPGASLRGLGCLDWLCVVGDARYEQTLASRDHARPARRILRVV